VKSRHTLKIQRQDSNEIGIKNKPTLGGYQIALSLVLVLNLWSYAAFPEHFSSKSGI